MKRQPKPLCSEYQLVSAYETATFVSRCMRDPDVLKVVVENGWVRVTHKPGTMQLPGKSVLDLRSKLQGLPIMQYKPLNAEAALKYRLNGAMRKIDELGMHRICVLWPRVHAGVDIVAPPAVPVFYGTPPAQFPSHAMFIYGSSPFIEDATGALAVLVTSIEAP
jgi:hypothetical protein